MRGDMWHVIHDRWQKNCQTPDLPIFPSPAINWEIWKALYLCGWLLVVRHSGDSFDDTLAFEDAQVITPFSDWNWTETKNSDDTDDTDATDDTGDTDDTDDTDDADDIDDTDYTDVTDHT